MTAGTKSTFQVFYGAPPAQRQQGPSFETLQEALDHVASKVGEEACDIRLPDGRWYAKQSTVLQQQEPGSAGSQAAADEVAWMRSRPSRSSPGGKDKGS